MSALFKAVKKGAPLLHKIKIADDREGRSSLLERQRWLQKLGAQQAMLAEAKRIVDVRTQLCGLERQKNLVGK